MKMLKMNGVDFYIDDKSNKWSSAYYTEEEAEHLSTTMTKGSRHNTNCENMDACYNCTSCTNLSDSRYSVNCHHLFDSFRDHNKGVIFDPSKGKGIDLEVRKWMKFLGSCVAAGIILPLIYVALVQTDW